jgi:hypothetical protein
VSVDSSASEIRGNKEFDWVLTPRVAGMVTMPSIRYPYFNPYTGQYEVAQTAPETLSILSGSLATLDSVRADTAIVMSIRPVFRGELDHPIHERGMFWFMLALMPVPAAVFSLIGRWRPSQVRDAAKRRLRSMSGQKGHNRVNIIRRVYVNAMGERLNVSAEELSRRGALARALRRSGVTRDTAASAEHLLRELDVAAYSGSGTPPPDAAGRAYDLYRRIDKEAMERDTLTKRILPVLIASLISASAVFAVAATAPTAEASFREGVRLYQARDFKGAERQFAEAAQQAPRSPDAWANYGTAAWSARNTAGATVGWQRALRLEPLAADVRLRLSEMRGWQRGNAEWVPPVPTSPVILAGALLWVVAWCVLLVRARRRSPRLRWWGPSLALASVVIVAGALQTDRILAADDLAVVNVAGPVRALPALGADRLLAVEPGQVVRTLELRPQWALIGVGSDREGWVERDRLTPIARAH